MLTYHAVDHSPGLFYLGVGKTINVFHWQDDIIKCFLFCSKIQKNSNSFMTLQPRMRSYSGLAILCLSYSSTSVVAVYFLVSE
jgi:hypothetical protein